MTLFETWDDKLGTRERKHIPSIRSTILHRDGADRIAMQYRATDVVAAHRDGSITLDSGGWRTPTTKARINEALDASGGAFRGEYD